MCLITFAYRSHPRYNLVLVANRDEFFARPTRSAHYWEDFPEIYAGRDLQEGGTWLGLTNDGKFSAVTNYRDGANLQQNKRSRGHLIRNFLGGNGSSRDFLKNLQPIVDEFGGFNLLSADSGGLHYLSNSGGGYRQLAAGIYGLSNAHLDTPWPKVDLAKQRLGKLLDETQLRAEKVMEILHDPHTASDDELPHTGISPEWEKQLSAQFIRIDGYGTRCTTVLLQEYSGQTVFFEQVFLQDGSGQNSLQIFKLDCFGSKG